MLVFFFIKEDYRTLDCSIRAYQTIKLLTDVNRVCIITHDIK